MDPWGTLGSREGKICSGSLLCLTVPIGDMGDRNSAWLICGEDQSGGRFKKDKPVSTEGPGISPPQTEVLISFLLEASQVFPDPINFRH